MAVFVLAAVLCALPASVPPRRAVRVLPGESSLAECASAVASGSDCVLAAGVHHGALKLPSVSPAGARIVGEGNGKTVLSGATPVPAAAWSVYRGPIYRATLPADFPFLLASAPAGSGSGGGGGGGSSRWQRRRRRRPPR